MCCVLCTDPFNSIISSSCMHMNTLCWSVWSLATTLQQLSEVHLCVCRIMSLFLSLPFLSPTGSRNPYVKLKHRHFKHRSGTVDENLNPPWTEFVSFKTTDLSEPVQMQVFDHDYRSADVFMGTASLNLAEFAGGG